MNVDQGGEITQLLYFGFRGNGMYNSGTQTRNVLSTKHYTPGCGLMGLRNVNNITESVDSVCRGDGTDMPYVAIQTEAWKTLL